jgi:hypothetical protein
MTKRSSKTIEILRSAVEAAEERKGRRGSYGAASDCRRINPKTGEVIEVIPRRGPMPVERIGFWMKKRPRH